MLRASRSAHWLDIPIGVSSPSFLASAMFLVPGILLMAWTVTLFLRFGEGTAAPWDPPRRFVIKGPYRHVRNPMITGVFMTLVAESLMTQSPLILAWAAVFMTANLLYIPLVEEKELERRFGEEYMEYKRGVPRWIPRLTAWRG